MNFSTTKILLSASLLIAGWGCQGLKVLESHPEDGIKTEEIVTFKNTRVVIPEDFQKEYLFFTPQEFESYYNDLSGGAGLKTEGKKKSKISYEDLAALLKKHFRKIPDDQFGGSYFRKRSKENF